MLTFGPRAARWAASLPADLPIIAVDETGIADAYRAAVEHRERAEAFFAWICIPAVRPLIARAVARAVHGGRSYDDQRQAFASLADGSLSIDGIRADAASVTAFDEVRKPVSDIVRLADGLFATSRHEADRIATTYYARKAAMAIAAQPNPNIALPIRRTTPRWIVVWADGTPFDDNLILVHALEEMRLPVVLVANAGEIFVRPGQPPISDLRDVLAGASVIIDASPDDPSAALRLARVGAPLAVAESSGAHEYVDGALTYVPWDWKSIYDATARALGAPAPRVRDLGIVLADARATIDRAAQPPPVDGPRVSVVIPTYNRRDRLDAALASIFRQQHRDLEVIVVNDGGEAVDDVVAAHPRARLISYAENRGPEHAVNRGFAAATGTYVTLIPDDDAFYPDHIARLVDACERSGCGIAHANTLIRFLRAGEDGDALAGFAANVFCVSLEKTEALYNSNVAGHAFIVRRDIGERLGWFDETLPVLGDQELQTRFAASFDFAHVDRVTVEWRFTGGEANISSRKRGLVPDAMRMWFARHPTTRARVNATRAGLIESVAAEPDARTFRPTIAYPTGE